MQKIFYLYLKIFGGVLLAGWPVQITWAGAWPSEAAHGQIIQTALTDTADKAYDANGKLTLPVLFSKFETSVFWEHGLSDDVTLVFNTSLQEVNFRAGVDHVSFKGFGETSAGVRRALFRKGSTVVSGQGSVIFAGPGESISDADLGIGRTQYEMRALLGHGLRFKNMEGFVDLQAAWRMRPSGISDEWRVAATAGWRAAPKVQLLAQGFYTNTKAIKNISRSNERLKLQASAVFDWSEKISYQFGLYQTAAGRTIVKENAYFFAVWQSY